VNRSAQRWKWFVVGFCAVIAVALYAGVLRQSWLATGTSADIVRAERQGVVYLHPTMGLIGQLVETQSAAVRGAPVDAAALRQALDSLATANGRVGVPLLATQRFADLRTQIEAALSRGPTGREAYDTYSDIVALAVDLAHRVGDTSHLVHDQDLDSYYVMDAALIRLPEAMVYAGRATDLVALAGSQNLSGDDAIRAAVARYRVASAAEEVGTGLNKSVDSTTYADLGTNIARQLDAFRAAVDSFSPPTILPQLAGPVDPTALAAGAHNVFVAALPLSHRLLGELDDLLAAREKAISGERRFETIAAAGGALLGLVLIGVAIVRPRTRRDKPGSRPAPTRDEEFVHSGQSSGWSLARSRGDAY